MDTGKPVLVTGAAGFIGFHLSLRLLKEGRQVVGLDNVNDYYNVQLKWDRLKQLEASPLFRLQKLDLQDRAGMEALFRQNEFGTVVHLAAQAGVRYSLTNPHAYLESNLAGFLNILEGCRHHKASHLVFASSSSVYGANTAMPFSVHHNVDHPVSLYAATKKANELMAHTYAHLYGLPCTGLRFFTVYGPWGRPDMALFLFTRAILAGKPIQVFNHGKMMRDFTYIDDIIEGVTRVMEKPAAPSPDWSGDRPDPGTSYGPYRIYNIGNNQPVELLEFISTLEECLGIEAKKELLPMQPGDVPATYADIEDLSRDFGFRPKTPLKEGIARFVQWYREYYGC
jgi:UDP-glucuronate 4-epimerase